MSIAKEMNSIPGNAFLCRMIPTRQRRTHPRSASPNATPEDPESVGIVGTPWAFFGKTETTGSGSLHFHVVLWGGLLESDLPVRPCAQGMKPNRV